MAEAVRNQYEPSDVSPPGETLQETIEALGMTQADLAERMGRPKKTINEIVQGKAAITPETALQLERVLRAPADFWMNRENHYREYLARQTEQQRLAQHKLWARQFPLRKMAAYGWIREHEDEISQTREILGFFGVASPAAWEQTWSNVVDAAFRKSTAVPSSRYAIATWLRAGERQARTDECAPFDAERFQETLAAVRQLSSNPTGDFVDRLRHACAESGVAVTFVPELPRAPIFGATRWLSPDRALLQLSLRYKSDDQFWFSFFHEAGHILKHGKRSIFIEADRNNDPREREADDFAARTLIPEPEYRQFVQARPFTKRAIQTFAKRIGIAPGIVVGRLQHDRLLPHSHCNDLKRRLDWAPAEGRSQNA